MPWAFFIGNKSTKCRRPHNVKSCNCRPISFGGIVDRIQLLTFLSLLFALHFPPSFVSICSRERLQTTHRLESLCCNFWVTHVAQGDVLYPINSKLSPLSMEMNQIGRQYVQMTNLDWVFSVVPICRTNTLSNCSSDSFPVCFMFQYRRGNGAWCVFCISICASES